MQIRAIKLKLHVSVNTYNECITSTLNRNSVHASHGVILLAPPNDVWFGVSYDLTFSVLPILGALKSDRAANASYFRCQQIR